MSDQEKQVIVLTRRCSTCSREQPLREFGLGEGFDPRCRSCRSGSAEPSTSEPPAQIEEGASNVVDLDEARQNRLRSELRRAVLPPPAPPSEAT